MSAIAKILVLVGLFLIICGVLYEITHRYLPWGRLPGDIAIEKENFRFYFPIASSILSSLFLSGILYFINYFKK